MRHISLMKLTDEGRKHLSEGKDVLAKGYEVIDGCGGKVEGLWMTTGRYDMVSVTDWPTPEAALKAHNKLLEMGYFTIEAAEAFDVDTYLATV